MRVAMTVDDLPLWPHSYPPAGYTAASIMQRISDALTKNGISGGRGLVRGTRDLRRRGHAPLRRAAEIVSSPQQEPPCHHRLHRSRAAELVPVRNRVIARRPVSVGRGERPKPLAEGPATTVPGWLAVVMPVKGLSR